MTNERRPWGKKPRAELCGLVLLLAIVGCHAALDVEPGESGLEWLPIAAELPQPVSVEHRIASGESLSAILRKRGVAAGEVGSWCGAAAEVMDLRRLAAGRVISLSYRGEQLRRLEYRIDDATLLRASRNAAGTVAARRVDVPVVRRTVGARGNVNGTFYASALRAGIPDPVISAMVDLLAWKINFSSDVRDGDRFRVLYEERTTEDGRPLSPGLILAAEYFGRRRSATAYLYEDGSGKSTHLDEDGRPVERTFLRYPLEFTRISSTFSRSRFHPILKRKRPHLGVDFAAPPGTPVRAIGDGIIHFSGRKGGFGRHVEIEHSDSFLSAYSHLRGIHARARNGARVRKGEVIGWVGQSGLATGPHLHFAIYERGRYVNPLEIRRPPAQIEVDPERFEVVRADLAERLRSIPGSYRPAPSVAPIALSSLGQARQLGGVWVTL